MMWGTILLSLNSTEVLLLTSAEAGLGTAEFVGVSPCVKRLSLSRRVLELNILSRK